METYVVPVVCTNCDYTGAIQMPVGVQFKIMGQSSLACPTCKCHTLSKRVIFKEASWMIESLGEDKFLAKRQDMLMKV